MSDTSIRFDDGAAYEHYMGVWSQLVGDRFLEWLQPSTQQRWVDVGCGNGAFTDLLMRRCAPASVLGVDPSPQQLAFAQTRFHGGTARFQQGDAMALPLPDQSVDHAVMALVIFFVPEPSRGVAEMARVVQPGGRASAYGWDLMGGGFPWAAMQAGLPSVGRSPILPPSPHAANLDVLPALWQEAGFVDVQTQVLTVQRSFSSFEDYWRIAMMGPSVQASLASLEAHEMAALKQAVHSQFDNAQGPVTVTARAHAVTGRKPQPSQ